MSTFNIVVDTSCDLPLEYINEHSIEILPIPFDLDGTAYDSGDWQGISDKEFYNALRNGGVAKTSQTNPDTYSTAFIECAKKGEDALFLVLSSGLSSTYQSAVIALQDVGETYPDCNIYPIDTIAATSGQGLLAMLAVKKRAEGLSAEETAVWLEKRKHCCLGFFTVDDLMYLHRGGRLSKLSAIAGSVLGIKPILNLAPNGTLALKDKARNRKAAFNNMINQIKRSIEPGAALDTVLISHTDCVEDAEMLAAIVRNSICVNQVIVMMMGPVIGAHLGPGAITLSFEADITREEYESGREAPEKLVVNG